jgi:ribosomal protein S18 acetylase RimI-like enzyme
MAKINLRGLEYGTSDLKAIAEIEARSFPGSESKPHSLRQMVDLFSDLTFIAEQDDQPVGFILGGLDIKEPQSAWLLSIAVNKECRGQGVAELLLNKLIDHLTELNIKSILLTVDPKNDKALPIFTSWGWLEDSQAMNYFENNDQRFIMRRPI